MKYLSKVAYSKPKSRDAQSLEIYGLDLKKIHCIQATPKWLHVILLGNYTAVSQGSTPKHHYLQAPSQGVGKSTYLKNIKSMKITTCFSLTSLFTSARESRRKQGEEPACIPKKNPRPQFLRSDHAQI